MVFVSGFRGQEVKAKVKRGEQQGKKQSENGDSGSDNRSCPGTDWKTVRSVRLFSTDRRRLFEDGVAMHGMAFAGEWHDAYKTKITP